MSTQQTAPTQYISANGTTLAYRRLGPSTGIPLVLHIHFRGNMDFWDPSLINPLAATRPVIIFDNAGIGKSGGTVPSSFAGWASNLVALVHALNIPQIDLLGFSMGGCAAQMVALDTRALVRKLILAGTRASINARSVNADGGLVERFASATGPEAEQATLAESFYTPSVNGVAQAKANWARMHERAETVGFADQATTGEQLTAWMHFETANVRNSAERLHELKMPVFVCSGDADILVPTANSFYLQEKIETAHLHIYPDAGHGFLFQYGALFAAHVNLFLDSE